MPVGLLRHELVANRSLCPRQDIRSHQKLGRPASAMICDVRPWRARHPVRSSTSSPSCCTRAVNRSSSAPTTRTRRRSASASGWCSTCLPRGPPCPPVTSATGRPSTPGQRRSPRSWRPSREGNDMTPRDRGMSLGCPSRAWRNSRRPGLKLGTLGTPASELRLFPLCRRPSQAEAMNARLRHPPAKRQQCGPVSRQRHHYGCGARRSCQNLRLAPGTMSYQVSCPARTLFSSRSLPDAVTEGADWVRRRERQVQPRRAA